MKVDDVIQHFGSAQEAARQLNLVGASAITNWRRRYNGRVPELYARRLHDMTRGKLKFQAKAYEQS